MNEPAVLTISEAAEMLHTCPSCGGVYHDLWRLHAVSDAHFWNRVRRGAGCWEWQGAKNRKGYGIYGRGTAHREAWRRTYGEIRDGLNVLHNCDNPPCCKPTHLFLGTNADNVADRVAKGRSVKQATHCRKGHPYGPIRPDGWNLCRICVRERTRGYIRPSRRKTA